MNNFEFLILCTYEYTVVVNEKKHKNCNLNETS